MTSVRAVEGIGVGAQSASPGEPFDCDVGIRCALADPSKRGLHTGARSGHFHPEPARPELFHGHGAGHSENQARSGPAAARNARTRGCPAGRGAPVDAAIANPQLQPPEERLRIGRARLEFRPVAPGAAGQDAVPTSLIARSGNATSVARPTVSEIDVRNRAINWPCAASQSGLPPGYSRPRGPARDDEQTGEESDGDPGVGSLRAPDRRRRDPGEPDRSQTQTAVLSGFSRLAAEVRERSRPSRAPRSAGRPRVDIAGDNRNGLTADLCGS